ncbi:helix-turn-helix domain-containing protein [Microvirga sp. 2YAF29]|uniref:helix-turn-helix domain-containing protein n=1 Tax=Microvirga sp. 2YAF29 TaxID=3233031 RepID=UPI003F94C670
MAARTWSTETVQTSESFSFWHEAVCQSILNVSIEAPSENFRADIVSQSVDSLRFACFSASGHMIVRNKSHIARSSEDHYLISFQSHGQSQMSQAGTSFVLEAGEIAVLDGQQPFQVGFPTAVQRVLAVIPRKSLDTRAPWLRRAPITKIGSNSFYADLARRHLLQLAGSSEGLGLSEASLLTENLCNLLALATAQDPASQARPLEIQVEEVLAFCRRHLSDPELSPRMIAAHCRMSVRTVHSRFERIGQTFGRWLIDNRLEACQRDLRDPRLTASSVSEIAYRWGFSDLSHFNKAFRLKFGMTPREWRARAVV